MNPRERFNAVMNFEEFDRLPILEWAPWWTASVDRWKTEGLPENLNGHEIDRYLGIDSLYHLTVGSASGPIPQPAYHGAGLFEGLEDYDKNIRPYMYNNVEGVHKRLQGEDLQKIFKSHEAGEAALRFSWPGFFWSPRTLFGIENHLYAFYDYPDLMKEMNQKNADWMVKALDIICQYCQPDFMTFAEDMSYNHGSMISEDIFHEFMTPYYKIIVPELKKRGIKAIIDSDGDIHDAAVWFEEAGLEGILPLERQAGVDMTKLREDFPNQIYIGAYDKMVMNKGEAAMRAEFERLLPAAKKGGFLISCDHQTPPGVSFEDYKLYLKLFREYAGLAAKK